MVTNYYRCNDFSRNYQALCDLLVCHCFMSFPQLSFSVLKKYGYRSMYVIVVIDKEYMASCVCKQPYKISSFKHWQFISWYEAIGTIYLFKQP